MNPPNIRLCCEKTARTGLEENYRNFQELDHQKNQEVLRRINADREKHNSALESNSIFIMSSRRGGIILLCVIGAALTPLASMVGIIRRDSDLKIKKLSILTRKE